MQTDQTVISLRPGGGGSGSGSRGSRIFGTRFDSSASAGVPISLKVGRELFELTCGFLRLMNFELFDPMCEMGFYDLLVDSSIGFITYALVPSAFFYLWWLELDGKTVVFGGNSFCVIPESCFPTN